MNRTYKNIIAWAKNRFPVTKLTLAATVKKPRPIIARFLSFKKKKRISVFKIKAEDKKKVSKHLFNRRFNPIAMLATKLCEN